MNNRFETKLEKEKKIVLRACLRISIKILSYQRKFSWRLARFEAWRSQSISDIRSSCTYLLFKSNIYVFAIVTSSQTRLLTVNKERYNDSTRISSFKTLLKFLKLQDKSSLQINARKITILLNLHSLKLETIQMYANETYKTQTKTRFNQDI